MHRTQILLEDWQYRLLRERAQRQGTSLAGLIRAILERELQASEGEAGDDGLWAVVGLAEGDGNPVSQSVDDYLYGPES